tara:strand:+ start:39 stop:524 length:486 start_codon:yes stop_codon:yes gene_type:complete
MKKTVRRVRKAPAKKKTTTKKKKAPAKKKTVRRVRKAPAKKKTVRRVRKAPAKKKTTPKKIPKKGGKYSGWIYAIINPSDPGWVKLGRSITSGTKIISRYNTNYRRRNAKLLKQVWVGNRIKAEDELHNLAKKKSSGRNHEWFKISQKEAIKLMKKVGNKF